jgi:hypothetical protein
MSIDPYRTERSPRLLELSDSCLWVGADPVRASQLTNLGGWDTCRWTFQAALAAISVQARSPTESLSLQVNAEVKRIGLAAAWPVFEVATLERGPCSVSSGAGAGRKVNTYSYW